MSRAAMGLLFGGYRMYNPELGELIGGLESAIILNQIQFVAESTEPDENGKQWARLGLERIGKDLCCSWRTAQRRVAELEQAGLIESEVVSPFDRRKQYRVNFDVLFNLPEVRKRVDGICQSGIDPHDSLASLHARDLLPDSKSTQKTQIHGATSAPSAKPQQAPPEIEPHWSEFVAAYPPRDGNLCRAEGQRIFARLAAKGEDLAAVVRGARGYRRHCDDKGSTGGPYVKQIPSFLNGRCWEEWMKAPAATASSPAPYRPGGKNIEGQLAKDREAAIRKAAIFGCSVGEIEPRFADE